MPNAWPWALRARNTATYESKTTADRNCLTPLLCGCAQTGDRSAKTQSRDNPESRVSVSLPSSLLTLARVQARLWLRWLWWLATEAAEEQHARLGTVRGV